MKSSLGEFCFRLLPFYPLGIVTCVLFILILFIISSCRIYEKKKGQIFLIIGGSIKHEVHMMMPFYDRMMLRKRYIIETINDMLKNTAQIVHSRHRSVSNFIMNLISALGHIASSTISQRHCRDTASKTPNICHYSKGKTTSFCLLLLPTSNGMGRRRMHAAFILYKTLGYPELRYSDEICI